MPLIWMDTPESCSVCYFISSEKGSAWLGYEVCDRLDGKLENDTDNSIPDNCPLGQGIDRERRVEQCIK